MPDFLCVLREPEYSPGKVEDDAAILLSVASVLRREQYVVDVLDPRARRWPELPRRTVVLNMAQGAGALSRLEEWEQLGIRVINSVAAVRNCYRARTHELFRRSGVSSPLATVVSTAAEELPAWLHEVPAVWVKRGDVHAMTAADVQFAVGAQQVRKALAQMRSRGIATAVVQQHVTGRTVKFYAVADQFFHVVGEANGSRATWERRLTAIARRAAQVAGLEVFGGDGVVDETGTCHLIDLNDWPSYAPCRPAAAQAIAAYARVERAKVA
ncbi:MAG: hypothetical protein N3C12_00780 [Candidatus Binatia bacterium]|nr:hypothetical protein [Candidatus Binatia bacterium]